MMDQEPYQRYLDAIRRKVCVVCLDGRGDGRCGLSGRVCAIEAHLPGVIEAVAAVRSDRMDDYARAIESQVCGACDQGGIDGECRRRDLGECALATYLYLVVDAIEEARA
jgi:hypothetical protein